ncbi:pilus assembly protein PilM [Acetanaerobacterium elongatum]|uniref:Tfp pilus assembly protein, ATPase PilM n=1 Tax=Acetanaerobacterium elongatum TaxID=258515 RepID=A0A1G9V406_9FIRM|nr:pilus assembly protein PilM [Acetanaerobacterium elongatum]SDM66971.1 Tfp pilus assembly protein, ATPase PilM [Acetanaerobacterium elongatum]
MISVDIGNSFIKIVNGEAKKGGVTVSKAVMVPTPAGFVSDGNLLNLQQLSETLLQTIKASGISSHTICFTVGSTEILHRELIVPKGDPKRMILVVQNEMFQHLSGADQYSIDYLFNDTPVEDNPLMQRVNASGMPKKMATQYLTLTNALHLKPDSLQMHPSAVAKLLKSASVNGAAVAQKSFIVCDIGTSLMHLYLYSGNKLIFSRCIKNAFPEFLRSLLMLDGFDTPEQIAQNVDLSPAALAENTKLSFPAGLFISSLSEEIQRMIQFSLSRRLNSPVEEIYLCGGVGSFKGLAANLSAQLDLPAAVVDRLSTVSGALTENLSLYINAVAAIAEP